MPTSSKARGRHSHRDPLERARRLSTHIRLLVFVVAALILMGGIVLDVLPFRYLFGVAALLAYPLATRALITIAQRRHAPVERLDAVVMQLDAAIVGTACAGLHFAVVPSIVLLLIVHAHTISRGGLRSWLLAILMTIVGAVLAAFVIGEPLALHQPPVTLSVLSLFGLGLYLGVAAIYARQQAGFLHQAQTQVRQQQRQAVDLSRKLAKYLPPQIWGSLFSGKRDAKLETRRKRLTVVFSDIKGFSAISEELPLTTLTDMLNTYLSEMTRIALRHGGTIDKFIGDAVMVFFGDPESAGTKEDAYRAAAMAIEMQQYMHLLRQRWKRAGITQKLEIRIGINTGYATVGNFGTESRMDYTILGTDVNLASRLESACQPGGVLVSESTFELINDRVQCRNVGEIKAKGFSRPIPVYEAQDLKRNAGGKRRYVNVETRGFGLYLDLERVPNFDKNRLLKALARSASELRKHHPVSLNFETEGFALFVEAGDIRANERDRVIDVMARAAKKIQEAVRM